jgi:hypothetical protein
MQVEAVAESVEIPEVADGKSLHLGSQAGRLEPLLGSEDRTVLPTDFEEERRNEGKDSNKKPKGGA